MKTDPLTGSRYPESTDGTNLALYFQNAVWDLADNAIPRFATTAARDTAYSTWVAAGGSLVEGLYCHVNGTGLMVYSGGGWRTVRQGYLGDNLATATGTISTLTPTTIHSITVTIPAGLHTGARVKVVGTVFCATGAGVGCTVIIAGGSERVVSQSMNGDVSAFRYDPSLTAGSRTYNLQVRSTVAGSDVTWRYPYLSVEIV